MVPRRQAQRIFHQLGTILSQSRRNTFAASTPLGQFDIISLSDLEYIWEWNAVVMKKISVCLQDIITLHISQRPCASSGSVGWPINSQAAGSLQHMSSLSFASRFGSQIGHNGILVLREVHMDRCRSLCRDESWRRFYPNGSQLPKKANANDCPAYQLTAYPLIFRLSDIGRSISGTGRSGEL